MEQRLFILLILTGFLDPGLSIGRNYKLIQTPKTWADARTYCRANYTDLATIQTSTELTRLQIKARNNLLSSSAWIGLYRPWRWTISNEPLGNVTFWASGEPAPIDNNIECAGLSPSKGVWTDYQCYMFKPYVCYDGNNPSASRYVYYSSPQTWYTAQRFCRQFHTELANPMNATEHAFIRTVITAEAWIGLIRDNWRWSDSFNGPSIGFSGQVDNAQLEENCMYLINSQVFDDLCTKLMPFFCYLGELKLCFVFCIHDFNVTFNSVLCLLCVCISVCSRTRTDAADREAERSVRSGHESYSSRGTNLRADPHHFECSGDGKRHG